MEHPKTGTGQVEELKGNMQGKWSRRIDKKNRLVYTIDDEIVTVEVISAKGHYGDK
ncbi:MAG: Txe/YoeB family addiction module toxin [Bacteroidota bacterium]